MKVIELFAGVGAPRMTLKKLGIEHEVIGISEISKTAISIYNSIHGETMNFGDISEIKQLPYCDFLWASSPCTSFSSAGKRDGLKGESKLLLEVYRLLENYKERNELPKYFGFENVPNLVTKFSDVFNELLLFLDNIGYNVYYEILNALYFDCPQKRERLFLIGIRKDIDKGDFTMPKNEIPTKKRLRDLLVKDTNFPEEFIHSEEKFHKRHFRVRAIPKNTLQTIELGYYFTENSTNRSQSNRIYSKDGVCPTLTTVPFVNLEEDGFLRRMMPIEYWRAMGFSDDDFYKIKNLKFTAIVKAIGNSICLNQLETIFNNLFKK